MKKYNPKRGDFGLTNFAILDRWQKDVFGRDLAEGDFVVAVHNNRILPGVVKEFTKKGRVVISPLESDLGGRRDVPPLEPFKREGYNCLKIDEKQITWATISGEL